MPSKNLEDIFNPDVMTADKDMAVGSAMQQMRERILSSVVIVENERPIGIFTEQDLVKSAMRKLQAISALPLKAVMSAPVFSMTADTDFRDAYRYMVGHHVHHLIVVDNFDRLLGIVSESDFIRCLGAEHLLTLKRVAAIMTRDILIMPGEASVSAALAEMDARQISSTLVRVNGQVSGILTARDVVPLFSDNADRDVLPLEAAMSRPLPTVAATDTVDKLQRLFLSRRIRQLAVVDGDGGVIGLVTPHDLVKGLEGPYIDFLSDLIRRQFGEREKVQTRLDNRLLLDSVLESVNDVAVMAFDLQGVPLYVNALAEDMLGTVMPQGMGTPLNEAGATSAFSRHVLAAVDDVLEQGIAQWREFDVLKDGVEHYFEMKGSALRDESGVPLGVLLIAFDRWERRAAEAALRESEERLPSVVENMPAMLIAFNAAGRIVFWNSECERVTGYSAHEVIGDAHALDWLVPDAQVRATLLGGDASDGAPGYELTLYARDGAARVILWRDISARYPVSGWYAWGVGQDITGQRQVKDKLSHSYDPLTTLPNRQLFTDHLNHAIRRAGRANKSVAVLLLGLDQFKAINKHHGYQSGDRLLLAISERIAHMAREKDIVARLGGDEFIILSEDLDNEDDVARLATRQLEALNAPFAFNATELSVSASAGISLYPRDGADSDTLIRNAATAMHRAKGSGSNTFQFHTHALTTSAIERDSLETELWRALENEQFVLYYQPQIDMTTARVVGTEALLRWVHLERGLVAPGHFLALAEENGQIAPIGQWVLRSAAAQARTWLDAGKGFGHIAVNVSARQMQRSDFISMLRAIIDEYRLPAHCLEIEVSETAIMNQSDKTLATLNALHDMGVGMAIDDFGTGSTSLEYLGKLPVQRLKIDHSFIQRLPDGKEDAMVVRTIMAMAKAMQLNVIAKGVEDVEQRDFLIAAECHLCQGFLYSEAVPAKVVESLFT